MIDATGESDQDLLKQFIEGNNASGVVLFTRYNPRLYQYCAKLVKNRAAAEDITQEIWEKIIKLRLKSPQVSNVAGFLFTIARNLCLNHLSASSRISQLEFGKDLHEVHQRELTNVEESALAALDELDFDDRELLSLHFYCGYGLNEIAAILNISQAAVWTRASRARVRLREKFKQISNNDKLTN